MKNDKYFMPRRIGMSFLLICALSASVVHEISAATITIKNNSEDSIVRVSDLTLFSETKQKGTQQVVLITGDSTQPVGPPFDANHSDDQIVAMKANGVKGEITINTTSHKTANPGANLINWKSWEVSTYDGTNERKFKGTKAGVKTFAYFKSDFSDLMYIAINSNVTNIIEGDLFSIVDGTNASLPDYFFSTTDFTINEDLSLSGATGFTGILTAAATIELSGVPIPAAAWLFGSGLLGLIGVARRKVRV